MAMLSGPEWSVMDQMFNTNVKNFIKTKDDGKCCLSSEATSEGAIQALSCLLGDWTPVAHHRENQSIFAKMDSSALQNLMKILISGINGTKFDVVVSSLGVLCHWASSNNGTAEIHKVVSPYC